ncbi:transporter substrate-binding domain-containing protein [Magnetospira sp. QH-2]|uniref:transporter substrate-binding domain-containing protein n=1 Tax=Magnetospira sp. (strain QH-2) TaxID=1288970 RepID=UPI0003E8165B|nr:transporter substrate-binding domain-containing protein [Magnetospira sp. QH-2]CCQ72861.1 membrane protein of unknown function [Magnetospira sp. QH-2]
MRARPALAVLFKLSLLLWVFMAGWTTQSVAAPDKLRVAYCQDCIPFHFTDADGNPAGMIIDFWKLWEQKTGTPVDFIAAPWDQTLTMVGNGQADAHAGLFYNQARDQFLDYGQALRKTDTHVFLHKSLPPPTGLNELTPYRVGVIAGDFVEGYLKGKLPRLSVVPFDTYDDLLEALKTGRLKAFAADTPTGLRHLARAGLSSDYAISASQRLYSNDWFIAVGEGNADLLAHMDAGMTQIGLTERNRIARRWTTPGGDQDDGSLVIALIHDYAPFSMIAPDGKPIGFMVDFWTEWSKASKTPIRFAPMGWLQTLEALRKGEVDIHLGMFKSAERESYTDFTSPLHHVHVALFTKRGERAGTLGRMQGRRVAVIEGTKQQAQLRSEYPEVEFVGYSETGSMITALLSDEVAAIVEEAPIMKAALNRLGVAGLTERTQELFEQGLHGAVSKGATDLLAKIEDGLRKIPQERLETLERRWFSDAEDRYYARDGFFLTDVEKAWLQANPVLRFAVTNFISPVDIVDDNGNYSGLNADLIEILERQLGVEVSPTIFSKWDDVIKAVSQGKVEAAFSVSKTPEREKDLLFTEPYAYDPIILLNRENGPVIDQWPQLAGRTVSVLKGGAYAAVAEPYLGDEGKIVTFDTEAEGIAAFAEGASEAHVSTLIMFGSEQKKMRLPGLTVALSKNVEGGALRLAVPKEKAILHRILARAVNTMPSREITDLRARWLAPPRVETVENMMAKGVKDGSMRSMLWQLGLITLGMILVLIIGTQIMRRVLARSGANIYQTREFKSLGFGLVALFLGGSLLVVWIVLDRMEKQMRRDVGTSLATVLNTTHAALGVWAEGQKRFIESVASDPELRDLVLRLLIVPPEKEALKDSRELADIRDYFDRLRARTGDIGFFIINNESINIGSMRDANLGDVNLIKDQRPDILKQVFHGQSVLVPPVHSDVALSPNDLGETEAPPTMFYAAPIELEGGSVLAALTFRIRVGADFTRILNLGRLGESGETYAIDENALLISESRFEDDLRRLKLIGETKRATLHLRIGDPGVDLTQGGQSATGIKDRPLTHMARALRDGETGSNTDGYKDYRGVEVFGAWTWDDTLRMGLATEIDADEALGSFHQLRWMVLSVILGVVLIGLGLTVFTIWLGRTSNDALTRAKDDLESRVKRLVRTETELYGFQGQIDAQMATYRQLFQLSQTLLNAHTADEALQMAADSCGDDLGYDRCAFFLFHEDTGSFVVHAHTGYWEDEDAEQVESIILTREDSPIDRLHGDEDKLTIEEGEVCEDPDLLAFAEALGMDEMLVLPLGIDPSEPSLLMAVGNRLIQADYMTRIKKDGESFVSLGSLASMASTVVTSQSYYEQLEEERRLLERRVEERTRELAGKEARIRAIMENVADSIITIDKRGIVESVNKAVERIFGHSAAEIIGQNIKMLMPSRFARHHDDYLARYLESGQAAIIGQGSREVEGLRADGTAFPIDLSVGETEIDGERLYVGVARDITERKAEQERLQRSEEKTRLLLESVGEGVFGVDREGHVTFINPAALGMLGYDPEDLLGNKVHGIIHHSHADGSFYDVVNCPMYKSYTTGEFHRIEDEVLWRKDGSPVEVAYHSSPIVRDGDTVGAVISFADITERKQAERERDDALDVISSSIMYASRIQRSILPSTDILKERLAGHFVIWQPRDVVGGDIYWCAPWGEGLLVILGDCTGHGVPGAFVTLLGFGALERAKMEVEPGDLPALVQRMHKLLQTTLGQHLEGGEADDGMELGACYFPADMSAMIFVGARFEVFIVEDTEVREIKGIKKGIGYRSIPADQVYPAQMIPLHSGQRFYLTTDGMIDQVGGERNRMYGKKRFRTLLANIQDRPLPDHRNLVYDALIEYQGDQMRRDDVSLMGLEIP